MYSNIPSALKISETVIIEINLSECAKPLEMKPMATVLLRFSERLSENVAVEPAKEMTCASCEL